MIETLKTNVEKFIKDLNNDTKYELTDKEKESIAKETERIIKINTEYNPGMLVSREDHEKMTELYRLPKEEISSFKRRI